jgi:hypothetical protein
MHKLSDLVFRVNAGDASTKRAGKYPELLAPLEATKRFFGFKESRGRPAQRHVGIAVAAHRPTDAAHGTIRILDDVCSTKTAHQAHRSKLPSRCQQYHE